MEKRIVANVMITPDGTRLQSYNRHDYKEHKDANGDTYMIDGGLEYVRSSVNKIPATYLTVYNFDPHDFIREHFSWGTYGINGDQPLKYVILKDMNTDHINAILEIQKLHDFVRKILEDELKFRG